jgi:predicted CopG family antitoxin
MASKLVSIREEIYRKLMNIKHADESFSDVIERLINNEQKNPLAHFGIGKTWGKEVWQVFEEGLEQTKKINIENNKRRFKELWGE